jgi:hypothetical protein
MERRKAHMKAATGDSRTYIEDIEKMLLYWLTHHFDQSLNFGLIDLPLYVTVVVKHPSGHVLV